MEKVKTSIIIPAKEFGHYLRKETIPAILRQSYQNFEIIILPDHPLKVRLPQTQIFLTWPKTGPAEKRDIGARKAVGEILAFLDDDSYPDKNWLKNALEIFEENSKVVGVCGPTLTPLQDNLLQKVSGYVWSTWLGSGGAGSYRCAPGHRRQVDDYPTVNLLVRKEDFLKVGGFNSHFWPGEDTKLCLDLTKKLGKKIIYDPEVLVYHHRREVFLPHLEQISRYAIHRGHFARILPETSLRLGYFLPTLFVLGLIGGPILIFILKLFSPYPISISVFLLYLTSILVYLLLLFLTGTQVFLKERNLKLVILVIFSIFITHLFYGVLFVKGFLSSKLER